MRFVVYMSNKYFNMGTGNLFTVHHCTSFLIEFILYEGFFNQFISQIL